MKARLGLIIGSMLLLTGLWLGWLRVAQTEAASQLPVLPPAEYVSTSAQTTAPVASVEGKPDHITIQSVGIDVPVIDGVYNPHSQTWTLSSTAAHYALITPLANTTAGNTFIYGHNLKNVFGKLLQAQAGDEAVVHTTNGHQFTYKLTSVRVTSPRDDALFYYHGAPILTLQTCSGTWDQNRSLYTFSLAEAH